VQTARNIFSSPFTEIRFRLQSVFQFIGKSTEEIISGRLLQNEKPIIITGEVKSEATIPCR
jgi:hypothetical protein